MIIGEPTATIGENTPLLPSDKKLCCINVNTKHIENVTVAFLIIE